MSNKINEFFVASTIPSREIAKVVEKRLRQAIIDKGFLLAEGSFFNINGIAHDIGETYTVDYNGVHSKTAKLWVINPVNGIIKEFWEAFEVKIDLKAKDDDFIMHTESEQVGESLEESEVEVTESDALETGELFELFEVDNNE